MKRGRPREFDRTEALEQAMILFWRNGYRGVSLDDLTDAMSITRPSLYAAFGDKETLFLAAVDYYKETVIMPRFLQLMGADDLAVGLSNFFDELCPLISSKDTPGCFIACMLTQESVESPEVKAKLADLINGADFGFARIFEKHRSQLQDSCEPAEAAQLTTAVVHGLAVRARSGASAEELAAIGKNFVRIICK